MVQGFWWHFGFWTFGVGLLLLEFRPSVWSPWVGAADVVGGFAVMAAEEWRSSRRSRV